MKKKQQNLNKEICDPYIFRGTLLIIKLKSMSFNQLF